MTAHALWRSLDPGRSWASSSGRRAATQTNFTFEDTLSQIGLGYTFLFVLALLLGASAVDRAWRSSWSATGRPSRSIRLPAPTSTSPRSACRPSWPHHPTGFAAHWDKNSNLAWAFDTWFLNLFPREKPFAFNGGGYATLSFIPTLGTMILGLLAGGVLAIASAGLGQGPLARASRASLGLAAGWGLGELGVCPVVKRIWTPSWVLFSGGLCFLFLAGFYAVLDLLGRPLLGLPAAGHRHELDRRLLHGRPVRGLHRQEPHHPPRQAGLSRSSASPTSRLLHGAAVLLVLWLILFWMYRRKMFLRI